MLIFTYDVNWVKTRGADKTPRNRPFKKERTLTVSSVSGYNSKDVPALRINGMWLEDLGFHTGDKVNVHCENGKLIIEKSEDQ